jgi:threonine/homoserine/homoserine lactone efflux protein
LTLAALVVLGALVLGYVAWRTQRRKEDAQKQAQRSSGGGGGPKEQA